MIDPKSGGGIAPRGPRRRTPADMLRRLLRLVREVDADALLLTGDIVNFPHNASVQLVRRALEDLEKTKGGMKNGGIANLCRSGNLEKHMLYDKPVFSSGGGLRTRQRPPRPGALHRRQPRLAGGGGDP